MLSPRHGALAEFEPSEFSDVMAAPYCAKGLILLRILLHFAKI